MQRKAFWAVLAVLAVLGGCAQRDPNLVVRGLGEFGRAAGDYTLSLKTYDLDADGRVRLAAAEDASLRGFVSRTLEGKGYTLKAAGPARYAVEAHLICADTRKASLGLRAEELRIPAAAAGAGFSEAVHYWLPEGGVGPGQAQKDVLDRRDAIQRRRSSGAFDRSDDMALGGASLGGQDPAHCQGRVLVTVTPAGAGPLREVFAGRAATDDCQAVPGCPLRTCSTALEQALVDLLERRF